MNAPPWAPRNILFANNVCTGQTGPFVYSDSYLPMSAVMIRGNIFAPHGESTAVLGPKTEGLVFTGNVFRSGGLPKDLPKGAVFRGNFVSPQFRDPPSGAIALPAPTKTQ